MEKKVEIINGMPHVDGVPQTAGTPFELYMESEVWLSDLVCSKNGWKLSQGTQINLKSPEWLAKGIGQYVSRDSSVYSSVPEFGRDSLFRNYRRCMLNNPDGHDGNLRVQFFLHEQEVRAGHLETILERSIERLEWFRKWDDVSGLQQFCTEMDMHLSDLRRTAPPKYLAKIEDLKEQAQRDMHFIVRNH